MFSGRRVWLLALAGILVACGGASDLDSDSTFAPATRAPTPTEVATVAATAAAETAPTRQDDDVMASTPIATNEPEPDPEPTSEPQSPCVRIADFTSDEARQAWFIVNDNVMGGRSSGGPSFTETSMLFEGEINTDGGGFSSMRVELQPDALAGSTEIAVRARTDGRPYKLILEDGLASRDRRVSQQGALKFAATTDWQVARVQFTDLVPKVFGRDVESEAFRPDLATQLGVMISDGVDGPFRIEIEWIDACP